MIRTLKWQMPCIGDEIVLLFPPNDRRRALKHLCGRPWLINGALGRVIGRTVNLHRVQFHNAPKDDLVHPRFLMIKSDLDAYLKAISI